MKAIWIINICCTVAFLFTLLFLHRQPPPESTKTIVFAAIQTNAQHPHSSPHYKHIAVGYNTNIDLIVSAVKVFESLGIEPQNDPKAPEFINSLTDLANLASVFMADGSAVERSIINNQVCSQIVNAAVGVKDIIEHVGGNAALMAMNMASESQVYLAGNLPSNLRTALSKNITLQSGINEPNIMEAHLILEYKQGERWAKIEAPRANRIIIHCDRTNGELKMIDSFHQNLPESVDMLVLSGLHLLEQMDEKKRKEKIEEILSKFLPSNENFQKDRNNEVEDIQLSNQRTLPLSIPVHLELASIGSFDLVQEIVHNVIPNVNSLGLNEQELGYAWLSIAHPEMSDKDPSERAEFVSSHFKDPNFYGVVKVLGELFKLNPRTQSQSDDRSYGGEPKIRRLERIHFHSLKYHIIAVRKENVTMKGIEKSEITTMSTWSDALQAVAKGSLMTTVKACNLENFSHQNLDKVEVLWDLPLSDPAQYSLFIYHEGNVDYYVATVMVCKQPVKTVGLGDTISSFGLLYHSNHHPLKSHLSHDHNNHVEDHYDLDQSTEFHHSDHDEL